MSLPKGQESKYDVYEGKIVNRATGVPIPDDEPIIIFRAQDLKLEAILTIYQELVTDEHHKQVIDRKYRDVLDWQLKNRHRVKEPDSDKSCLV